MPQSHREMIHRADSLFQEDSKASFGAPATPERKPDLKVSEKLKSIESGTSSLRLKPNGRISSVDKLPRVLRNNSKDRLDFKTQEVH